MNTSKKGFTLIELIVVLAILAIVAAIAVPTAFGAIENARVSADEATVSSLNSAIRYEGALGYTATTVPTTKVGAALTEAGIDANFDLQSANTSFSWVPGTEAGDIGHFEFKKDTTGTYKKGDAKTVLANDTDFIFKQA